jgi:hypothetical protein
VEIYIPVIKNVAKMVEISPNLVISIAWHLLKTYSNDDFKRIYTANLGKISHSELEDIILASFYLKELKNKFKSQKLAIIAYNMGSSRVKRQMNRVNFGSDHDYFKKVSEKMNLLASN